MNIRNKLTIGFIILLLGMVMFNNANAEVARIDNEDGTYAIGIGKIEVDDAKVLAPLLKGESWDGFVFFNSGGGSVGEAFEMARLVRTAEAITVVTPGRTCASACAFVFVAGVDRRYFDGAVFGIHAASSSVVNPNNTLHDFGYMNQIVMLEVLNVMMYYVPEAYEYEVFKLFYKGINDARHDQMYWATNQELVNAGIVTDIYYPEVTK